MKKIIIILSCILIASLQTSCFEKKEQKKSDLGDYNQAINKVLNKPTKKENSSKPKKKLTAKDYKNEGIKEFRAGNYEKSIKYFNQAIKLNPKYALAYNNRCSAKIELEMYESALKDCNIAIRYNPKLTLAYYNKSRAFFLIGNYEEGMEWHNKYEKLKGDD